MKESGLKPRQEVLKNGCTIAMEASTLTPGQPAGIKAKSDLGNGLPAVREQKPPGRAFYSKQAAPSTGMNLEAGSSWGPVLLQTGD